MPLLKTTVKRISLLTCCKEKQWAQSWVLPSPTDRSAFHWNGWVIMRPQRFLAGVKLEGSGCWFYSCKERIHIQAPKWAALGPALSRGPEHLEVPFPPQLFCDPESLFTESQNGRGWKGPLWII